MNTAKNTVFIGLQLENCCLGGEGLTFGGGIPPPYALVGKTLMFDYLTKTSINCIVWESNISIRIQK